MTDHTGVHVLDVGHGSCLAIVADDQAVLIDAGQGATMLRFLKDAGVRHIPLVLLSHADADHIGGLIGLLSSKDFTVGTVWVNSDAQKTSATWTSLVWQLSKAEEAGDLDFRIGLKRGQTFSVLLGLCLHVLAPRAGFAATGPGSAVPDERRIRANSMSAVVKITRAHEAVALIPGDLDDLALDHLLAVATVGELEAPILVYPHHGGRAGATAAGDAAFITRLCAATKPHSVVFSTGRGRQSLREETVKAVRSALPSTRLMCTQLSPACAADKPTDEPPHLLPLFARGRQLRECCGGTITLVTPEGAVGLHPHVDAHQAFIDVSAPTALCRV